MLLEYLTIAVLISGFVVACWIRPSLCRILKCHGRYNSLKLNMASCFLRLVAAMTQTLLTLRSVNSEWGYSVVTTTNEWLSTLLLWHLVTGPR